MGWVGVWLELLEPNRVVHVHMSDCSSELGCYTHGRWWGWGGRLHSLYTSCIGNLKGYVDSMGGNRICPPVSKTKQ